MNIDNLKKAREAIGLTQPQVADKLGISDGTYKNYEQGKREPNNTLLLKIADLYEVTTDYLLGRETKKEPDVLTRLSKEYNLSETEKILVSAYLSISKSERAKFIETIEKTIENKEQEEKNSKPPIFIFRHFNANRASAGFGYDLQNDDIWQELAVVDTPEARQADFAVEIEGRSMEPTYKDGDIVYIVIASEVPIGKIGLFTQNGKGYIKEVGESYLISHNPDFPNIYPSDGKIECVGRVIGVAELPD